MPVFKMNTIGAWEDDRFIGALVFGLGAAGACNGAQYGLKRNFEMVELQRVALTIHQAKTTRIIAIAIRLLKEKNPLLRLIVSFADTRYGHHGGIYQGGGWVYSGDYGSSGNMYRVCGVEVHAKTLHSRYGTGGQSIGWLHANVDPKACRLKLPIKHRYLMPLDDEMRKRIEPLRKPYPKRAVSSDSGMPGQPAGKGRCESDHGALQSTE